MMKNVWGENFTNFHIKLNQIYEILSNDEIKINKEMLKRNFISGFEGNRLTHTHTHTQIHTNTHTHTNICVRVCICVRMYVCIYIYMYVYMHVCMNVCMYVFYF